MFLGFQNNKVKFYTLEPLNKDLYNIDHTEETDLEYTLCGDEYLPSNSEECIRFHNEIRVKEIKSRLNEIDIESSRPLRAIVVGTATEKDRLKITELEEEAEALREELRGLINE